MRHSLGSLPVIELLPGFRGRFVHSDAMTFVYWDIARDAEIPEHAHPHEQVVNVFEGDLELIVGGEVHELGAGDVFVIPGDVRHSARGITDCRVLDVFQPVREDYRALSERHG